MNTFGTRKVYWPDIKNKIKEANLEFYLLIDKLDPGQKFPLYLLNFPYGELIGDRVSQFIPLENKGLMRLNDSGIPKDIIDHLGYGKNNSPMGMILEKQVEWYVDLPQKAVTLPIMIQKPGDFYSYTRVIDIESKFNYSPMGILSTMSGARTTFMIPSIGCQHKLTKLCRELGIKAKLPKNMYDHFKLFKVILNSIRIDTNWNSSVLYFSENWINNIKKNPEWFEVQKYFCKIFAQKSMYLKNQPHYQTAYSLLLETTNQKPNPYLFDTFKHLIDIMSGEIPGFSPQITNDLLPLEVFQDVFINHYCLKDVVPTIMGPNYFNIENEHSEAIYYSLQFPTTRSFSPHSKKTSAMVAMRELKEICVDLLNELARYNYFFSDTIIQYIANNIDVSFFHNTDDIDGLIDNITELILLDKRFYYTTNNFQGLIPAEDSKFFRGCISMTHKNK